jgi:hypothetical protein
MADNVDPKLLDKRTLERYLTSGLLDDSGLDRHLKSLPDVADKSEPISTVMGDDEAADDGDDDNTDLAPNP